LTEGVERPLLFVDIDGVLNPYEGPCPAGFSEQRGQFDPALKCPPSIVLLANVRWHGSTIY